jgi:hypothetical protein
MRDRIERKGGPWWETDPFIPLWPGQEVMYMVHDAWGGGGEVALMERFGMETRWNWVGFYGLVMPGTHYSPLYIAITHSFPRFDTPRDLGALEREKRRRRRRRRKAAYTRQTLWTAH